MGSYQGQAALVLGDQSKIEGQASIRTSRRSWEGTVTIPSDGPFERAGEVTGVELPTGETRAVTITDAEFDGGAGTSLVTFASDDQ